MAIVIVNDERCSIIPVIGPNFLPRVPPIVPIRMGGGIDDDGTSHVIPPLPPILNNSLAYDVG